LTNRDIDVKLIQVNKPFKLAPERAARKIKMEQEGKIINLTLGKSQGYFF
jgi:hypothetical protein